MAIFGPVFEESPWIAAAAWERRPFSSPADLREKLVAVLRESGREKKLTLIRAHPDLAGRLARENKLTAASRAEQAGAGLDRLSEEELARFEAGNARYREKFGFPFVICARLNDKAAILSAFARRLENDPQTEFDTALAEIEKIATLRLEQIFSA